MLKPPVASVINFCTNEARFLRACIEECRLFSRQIVIPVCDRFHDGTPENRSLLCEIYRTFPDCFFVEYPFVRDGISPSFFCKISPEHFWHSASRAIGCQFLSEEIERVLFLDADEVPEGKRFLTWLEESDYAQHTVLKLANYWYFREPCFRADQWEDSIVLARRRSLDLPILLHDEERNAIYDLLPPPKRRRVVGSDRQPIFHHFSWVRTKEEMLRKTEKWGHRNDRDWKNLIETEFASPFSGKDFIHGYSYQERPPLFNISLGETSFSPEISARPKVRHLTEEELFERLELPRERMWKKFFTFGRG